MGDVEQTGRVVSVDFRRDGSRLTADASIGATVLYVEQPGDFDEDGGQVLVGGDVYTYSNLDEDAGSITIDPALSVASVVDDPVDIFDTEVGTIVVEYVALVLLDDQDPGDEPIEVSINHGLFDYLAAGVRGAAAENVTLSPDGPDDYVITQVDGKEVDNLAVDEAVTLAGEAITQAEDSLTAAQLAQAILDGEIDYYYTTSAPWANGSTAHDDDLGDVWVDTDSDPKVAYRWGVPVARTWNVMADGGLVAVLFAAQDAQVTADGKIKHFVGSSAPTAEGYGDIWTDTGNDNKKFYWDGDSWEPLPLGSDGIASEIIGKIITGGLFRTDDSGQRIELTSSGQLKAYDSGGNLGVLYLSSSQFIFDRTVRASGLTAPSLAPSSGPLSLSGSGVSIDPGVGTVTIVSRLQVPQLDADLSADMDAGGHQITDVGLLGMSGAIDLNGYNLNDAGAVHAGRGLFDDSVGTANPAKFNSSGRVVPDTSSARYKTDIQPAAVDTAAMRRVEIVTYLHQDGGGRVELGGIAEQVAEQGLEHLVIRDADGRPDAIDRAAFTFAVLALAQEQAARLDTQAAQIADLTARIDALEA